MGKGIVKDNDIGTRTEGEKETCRCSFTGRLRGSVEGSDSERGSTENDEDSIELECRDSSVNCLFVVSERLTGIRAESDSDNAFIFPENLRYASTAFENNSSPSKYCAFGKAKTSRRSSTD